MPGGHFVLRLGAISDNPLGVVTTPLGRRGLSQLNTLKKVGSIDCMFFIISRDNLDAGIYSL